MTKFKIGDRVRVVVGPEIPEDYPVNVDGIIKGVDSTGANIKIKGRGSFYYFNDEIISCKKNYPKVKL